MVGRTVLWRLHMADLQFAAYPRPHPTRWMETGEHVLQAAWVVLKVALYADDEAEAARRQLQRLNDPTAHAVEDVRALDLDV